MPDNTRIYVCNPDFSKRMSNLMQKLVYLLDICGGHYHRFIGRLDLAVPDLVKFFRFSNLIGMFF